MSVFLKAKGTLEQENSIEQYLKDMDITISTPYLAFLRQAVEEELYNMECNEHTHLLEISEEEFDNTVDKVAGAMYNNSLFYQAINEYVREHIDLVLKEC